MSHEEALRRARQGLNALRLEVDESIVTHLTALVETAFAALSEGQAPEPVAQEPVAFVSEYSLDRLTMTGESETVVLYPRASRGCTPLYTHPAGMDAARHETETTVRESDDYQNGYAAGKAFGMDAARAKAIEGLITAACNLWDNRLGHRPDNPCWHAPKDIWEPLGAAVRPLRVKCDGDHGGPRCADPECWQQ